MKLILVGFMGSGKTTISKLLGEKLNLDVRDLDQEIVKYTQLSINDIFKNKGEAYFRKLEYDLLQKQTSFSGILATGGGTIMNDNCLEYVSYGDTPVILLDMLDEDIKKRLGSKNGRPIASLKTTDELIELKHKRDSRYHRVANLIINTNSKQPEVIVSEIMFFLNKNKIGDNSGTRR
ncbi:shikimate kinase [Fructilactobacillus vespulae]|uniref:shikimate kinase n=1 Tax=Fructilactobacillus vespulae TaxID=1249630 RepID=UPI0039B43AAC